MVEKSFIESIDTWGQENKMTFRISDILIGGSLVIIGFAEIAHLAGCLSGWSFLSVTDLLLAETVIVALAACVAKWICTRSAKKAAGMKCNEMRSKLSENGTESGDVQNDTEKKTTWMLNGILAFLILLQLLRIATGDRAWLTGDMTLETVNTFLKENAIYSVNPLTGGAYAAGMSFRLKLLCLPTLYGAISRFSGIAPKIVVYRLIPCITLLLGYFAYGRLGKAIFKGDSLKIRTFLLVVGILFCTGAYMPGVDGFDLFYGGFRGVTIRAIVLIPYLIACLMDRKYFGVLLCILAEDCMVWTLYGAGVCLLITVAWMVLQKLMQIFVRKLPAGKVTTDEATTDVSAEKMPADKVENSDRQHGEEDTE